MKIGYARVSTKEQHLDMQLEALKAAGCEKIFSEKMTGRQQNRPELDACLSFLREGDTLVVYKLDRLGRSLKNILTLLEDFKNRGIQFTSLQDNISTEGAIGQQRSISMDFKLVFQPYSHRSRNRNPSIIN